MNGLFNDSEHILFENKGRLSYCADWLSHHESFLYFRQLYQDLDWKEEILNLYGKDVSTPRLVAWYGDADAIYTYSGKTHHPLTWHPLLLLLKNRLEQEFHHPLNSVLANLYRNGHDSMGWHADNEAALGKDPNIFSVSLGASRFFDIRRKEQIKQKSRINLENGSLLIMSGAFQQHWQHQVPRQLRIANARINLTFRYIHDLNQT